MVAGGFRAGGRNANRSFSMKPKVYIETSIVSYLMARPSRDLLVNANQILAKEWWNEHRMKFRSFVSEVVISEIERGDPAMAKSRLEAIKRIEIIRLTNEARTVAQEILDQKILPEKAAVDALHISIASVNAIDFLLSLNCKHIANAFLYRRVHEVCRGFGYQTPTICTLQEILEKENEIYD